MVSTFWSKKLLCHNSIGIRILYSHFENRPSDVDKVVFSAFRTRFSASEYTYTAHPKNGEKKPLRRNDFLRPKCVSCGAVRLLLPAGVPQRSVSRRDGT